MAFVLTTVQASDFNNTLQAGAKLYLYAADGVTLQAGYQDKAGSTAHLNPIVCSASGQEAVWLDDTLTYRLILRDAADANTYFDQVIDPSTHPTGLHIYPAPQGDQSVKTTDNVAFAALSTATANIARLTTSERVTSAQFETSSPVDFNGIADNVVPDKGAIVSYVSTEISSALGSADLDGTGPIDNGSFSEGIGSAVDLGNFS